MKSFKKYKLNSILADPEPAAKARRRHSTIHGLLAALTLAGCIAHGAPTMATEEPRYEVLESEDDLEIRRYEPFIVAETLVDADFERAGNEGFRRLADYIFGNNRSRQKLEMTAPVSQTRSEKIAMTAPVNLHRQGNLYRVTFMMPAEYTLATLPEPVNPDVRLRQVPAELVAALRYSGRWSQQRYQDHKARLESWVAKRGWHPAGEPILARYDPPFKPWFLRRNEVLIPLSEGSSP
jgi:hypothetical protein